MRTARGSLVRLRRATLMYEGKQGEVAVFF